jgi:hypothetical protein
MNTIQSKIAISAGLFLCIIGFGFWLSLSGKPYNQVIFTIHKLVALVAVIYLARTVYRAHRAAPLSPAHWMLIALTSLCVLAAFITGALLSRDQAMPQIVLRLHQLAPFLILLTASGSLVLCLTRSIALYNPENPAA